MVKFCGTPVRRDQACAVHNQLSSRGGQSILGLQMPFGNLEQTGLAGLVASAVTNLGAGDDRNRAHWSVMVPSRTNSAREWERSTNP
jgi:hypothetical protein